jgi:hypothetical protein
MSSLRLDFVDYKAAKFACENWHYSRRMPDPKCVKIGAWENEKFIGVIIFSRGVSGTAIAKRFGLAPNEIAELSRVALRKHDAPVSRMIRIATNLLKKQSPGIRLLLSYADENQGHLGVIYQAANWIYNGKSASVFLSYSSLTGKRVHDRNCSNTGLKRQFGAIRKCPKNNTLIKVKQRPKWRYLYPLDSEMRERITPIPYPKRAGSDTLDTPANHAGKGGSLPTPALPS